MNQLHYCSNNTLGGGMDYYQTKKLIALGAILLCQQVANAGDNSNLHPIPDDQPAFCQPILSTHDSTTFGDVCASTTGDSVELLINVTAADEGCCLKETHICNYPSEQEFTQGCELVTIYAFNMSSMYNFMCEGDPCQTFQLDGHATLQCDDPNTTDIEQEIMMSAMFFVNFGCGDCDTQADGCDKCSSNESTCVASYDGLHNATSGAADGDTISICAGATIGVTEELTIEADNVAICCPGPEPCIMHTVGGNHGILHATGDTFALCGVTLLNGNIPDSSGVGGNIRITGSGDHTINGCRMVNGTASGGGNLYVKPSAGGRQGTVAIADSSFETGTANSGGGIFISNVLDVTIDAVDFISNSADTAGGLFVFNVDNVEILFCTFLDNTASFHGGGFYIGGSSSDPIDSLKVTDSTFNNNTATQFRGGAGYIWSDVATYTVNTNSGSSNSAGTDCNTIFVLGPILALQTIAASFSRWDLCSLDIFKFPYE